MKKSFNKVLIAILAVIMILSSVPIDPIVKDFSNSPIAIVAHAASKKTHLNATKKSIYIGKKYTLKLIDKKGKTISASKVKWSTSNKSVATVSKGVVTGKKSGKVKITATYEGKKYTATITVKSAVSVSTSKVTFKAGETAKKTIKITCKDNKGIKWKVVSGKDIVKLSQAKKWSNDTKRFYITPTGKKFGTVKIKIYSVENSNSYAYVNVDVKAPYTLKVKNKLPCTINNYSSQYNYEEGTKNSSLKITKVSYKTPNTKTINITLTFEARNSLKIEDYYYIKYRILDKNGFLVESDNIKSKLMMVGDKAKAEISLKNLKNGSYTIEFRDYIAASNGGSTLTTDSPAADSNPITKDPLAAYQKAAKEINTKGVAGYNKIGWQQILEIEGLGILDSIIVPILESFITAEDEAEVKVNEKGSEDAMHRMPISNCSKSSVKSATANKLANGNYKVVIVMNEQTNPSYDDTDGLAVMSRDFLDYADVQKEAANIAVVKSLEGEIKYVDYTITAEMTADGKFASITHYGIGYINANLNGSINAYGELEFNAKYTDFKY